MALNLSRMGDPRFRFSRLFKPPKALRNVISQVARGAIGAIPGFGTAINIAKGMFPGPDVPLELIHPGAAAGFTPQLDSPPPLATFAGGGGAHRRPVTWGIGGRDPIHAAHRHRRQNVTNVHALRRSMRRVQGFAKLASRVMTFTKTHRMKKRGRRR
jgi:hypothetical protein